MGEVAKVCANNIPKRDDMKDKMSLEPNSLNMDKMDLEPADESSHKNQQYVYCIDNKVLVIMRPHSKIHFVGKLKVYVLFGSVEIYGYNCTPDTENLQVYSPKCHSFVPIQSTEDTDPNFYDLTKVRTYLTKEGVDLDIQSSLTVRLKECTKGWAVILLQNLENPLTTFLDSFCQFRLFPKIEGERSSQWNDIGRAENLLQCHLRLNSDEGQVISMSPRWKNKVALNVAKKDLISESKSRCIVFGGKGVGKSTAVRFLINHTLPFVQKKKFILLDLDPGQTECTPAGSISLNLIGGPLLGPNFTHLSQPYYEIALGEIDVGQCVIRYLEGVERLVAVLNGDEKLKGYSVIVNTMGFCKGIGSDIACSIIKLIRPTDVVQVKSRNSSNNFESQMNPSYVNRKNLNWIKCHITNEKLDSTCSYDFISIESEIERFSDSRRTLLKAADYREIVLLSYLSKITENVKNILYDEESLNINNVVPHVVSFSSIYVSLARTTVPSTQILNLINGNVVALCHIHTKEIQNNYDTNSEGIKVFIRPVSAKCYGHGIVRGIDIEKKLIFIISPLKIQNLQRVNCLMGCTATPKTILELEKQDDVCNSGNDELPTSRNTRRGFFQNFKPPNVL